MWKSSSVFLLNHQIRLCQRLNHRRLSRTFVCRWKFIREEVKSEMATQAKADDESYKREYRRIQSLVSSAYVRQTSVSFLPPSCTAQNLKNCGNVLRCRTCAFNCYVRDVIYSIHSRPMSAFCAADEKNCYWIRGTKEVSIVMQHIRRMGSDCLIFIDSTTNRKAPESLSSAKLSGGTVKTPTLDEKLLKVS